MTLVVLLPGAGKDLVVLGPADDLHFRGRKLGAVSAILIPGPTSLASIDQSKVSVGDGSGDLGDVGIPGVGIWGNVAADFCELWVGSKGASGSYAAKAKVVLTALPSGHATSRRAFGIPPP